MDDAKAEIPWERIEQFARKSASDPSIPFFDTLMRHINTYPMFKEVVERLENSLEFSDVWPFIPQIDEETYGKYISKRRRAAAPVFRDDDGTTYHCPQDPIVDALLHHGIIPKKEAFFSLLDTAKNDAERAERLNVMLDVLIIKDSTYKYFKKAFNGNELAIKLWQGFK